MTSNPDPLKPPTVPPSVPPSSSTKNPQNLSCNTQQEEFNLSNSPYLLHHSDTSNLVLVTEPLTDDNYYVNVHRSMILALSIRNKLGFIDGTITKATGELLPLWIRNNNVVIAWIFHSVSKSISSSILFTESARAGWSSRSISEEKWPKNFPVERWFIYTKARSIFSHDVFKVYGMNMLHIVRDAPAANVSAAAHSLFQSLWSSNTWCIF